MKPIPFKPRMRIVQVAEELVVIALLQVVGRTNYWAIVGKPSYPEVEGIPSAPWAMYMSLMTAIYWGNSNLPVELALCGHHRLKILLENVGFGESVNCYNMTMIDTSTFIGIVNPLLLTAARIGRD